MPGNPTTYHDVPLAGCRPEPLLSYLKALGVLRLVSEQKDPAARGWWKNGHFWIRSTLDADQLLEFFIRQYRPTPIVVPWSGGDFFEVNWGVKPPIKFDKTPTAGSVIEAFLASTSSRLEEYRQVLRSCKEALDACGIKTKREMEEHKWLFIRRLRAICPEERTLCWMDAASVDVIEKFAPLLGSGGGSDGNTHFSDNFMQNLWDVLPDFDEQRELSGRKKTAGKAMLTIERSTSLLRNALFGEFTSHLVPKRTSALFDAGAGGGPNATQGLERDSLGNPWSIILGLEGTICFAGALARRCTSEAQSRAAFPFMVPASVTSQALANAIMTQKPVADSTGSTEIWLPIWDRPASKVEMLAFMGEGRAEWSGRPAASALDMVRAIASLGVQRGISMFLRCAIAKGRVGGENYNTSFTLGVFPTRVREKLDLLRQVDWWVVTLREMAGRKDGPSTLAELLWRIETAIFNYCKYGGTERFQDILIALGAAERRVAVSVASQMTGAKAREGTQVIPPLGELDPDWIDAVDDGSDEFRLALALAGIYDHEPDRERNIGPLRSNLEPVEFQPGRVCWSTKGHQVVWSEADLETNLVNILHRRVMDSLRTPRRSQSLPLDSPHKVPLGIVARFLHGALNLERVKDLLWGLALVRPGGRRAWATEDQAVLPLPRQYALLKLLFLSHPLKPVRSEGRIVWTLARSDEEAGVIRIRPELRVISLLSAGRIGEACRIAAQRLRASGLVPMPRPAPAGDMRDNAWAEDLPPQLGKRLAAALLIPCSDVNRLVNLVCAPAAELVAAANEVEQQSITT